MIGNQSGCPFWTPTPDRFIRLTTSSFAAHVTFGIGWLEHLVGLHHAAVGEAAVVFIRIASPREVGRGASASA